MSKVICDICGTTYPDTADQCPICGCSRDLGAVIMDDQEGKKHQKPTSSASPAKGGRFAAKKARKSILSPVVYDEEEDDFSEEEEEKYRDEEEYGDDFAGDDEDYDDYDDYEDEEDLREDEDEEDDDDEEESGAGRILLVVFLTILIIAMLAVSGFLFFRYFLPNQTADEQTVPTTEAVLAETEESTVPTVPCVSLALTGGSPSLSFEGQNWLLNVVTVPEDTTDVLTYTSADESVVTVTEQGRVTAVGEGNTVIYITCGDITMECNVTVAYVEETEPSETAGEETSGETQEGETVPEETVEGETIAGESEPEETEPEETKELIDVDLWCNYKDMTLFYRGETVTLRVNQELTLEDLEWTSENENVATVENGVIKAVGHGNTKIIGRYGEQEVSIIVRCAFW